MDKTRVDVYIDDKDTLILSNYDKTEIIPTSQSLLNLLTVFTLPEKIVLHVHDDRKCDKRKNLSYSWEVDL